jgi:hypothetical protein
MKRAVISAIVPLVVAACSPASPTTSTTVVTSPTTSVAVTVTTASAPSSTTTLATTTTAPEPGYDLAIEGADGSGVVIEGPGRFEATLGEEVSIRVLSSIPGELHVHGYDLFFDLVAGAVIEVAFPADIPGIFEAELEDSHTLVFELEVNP